MKKLIKLLNEYEKENGRNFEVTEIGMTYRNNDLMVISKRYGFIQRLVENNKIDESKIEIHWFSFYESVLMELAIKDNPIEFLISILK